MKPNHGYGGVTVPVLWWRKSTSERIAPNGRVGFTGKLNVTYAPDQGKKGLSDRPKRVKIALKSRFVDFVKYNFPGYGGGDFARFRLIIKSHEIHYRIGGDKMWVLTDITCVPWGTNTDN